MMNLLLLGGLSRYYTNNVRLRGLRNNQYSVRGGGLRFCRRDFNRRVILEDNLFSLALRGLRLCRRDFNRRVISKTTQP